MAKKYSLVRTIYLYIFALLGLVFLITGAIRFIDMGLKATIFKGADAPERYNYAYSCQTPLPLEKLTPYQEGSALTEDEKTTLKNFLERYKQCQEEGQKIDYISAQRQREASSSIAMILVGLPLYLYHWGLIKKETRERELEEKGQTI